MKLNICEITEDDISWSQCMHIVELLGQTAWIRAQADRFRSSQVLAAFVEGEPVGFLRFVVQRLGEDEERPPIHFKDQALTEAKIIAFGVVPDYRNQGIGRALQQAAMQRAKTLGCYQVRSRSDYANAANFHLKIALGFGIQPSLENDSVYFVKILRAV
jgi:GNAT superfamily N-acetyltransferase